MKTQRIQRLRTWRGSCAYDEQELPEEPQKIPESSPDPKENTFNFRERAALSDLWREP